MDETRLVIVTWLWKNKNPHRAKVADFGVDHVNTLARALDRNLERPYRFVCITDTPDDKRFECETFPLWDDFTDLTSHPHSDSYVSCYPRLKIFDKEVGEQLDADIILSLDLDTIVTGPLDKTLDTFVPPFVGLRCKLNSRPLTYNGSMFMFEVGHPDVTRIWDEFDLRTSPELARMFGYRGSDQAWISYTLGDNYPTFDPSNGIYSYRKHVRQMATLPPGAAMVHFFGRHNPWHNEAQGHTWVREAMK